MGGPTLNPSDPFYFKERALKAGRLGVIPFSSFMHIHVIPVGIPPNPAHSFFLGFLYENNLLRSPHEVLLTGLFTFLLNSMESHLHIDTTRSLKV